MSYDRWVSDAVQVVEGVGAATLVVGGVVVSAQFAARAAARRPDAYRLFRRSLGRVIQVGLEILIVADIIRAIIVTPTLASVGVLTVIVAVRIAFSWSLEVEIGVPGRGGRRAPRAPGTDHPRRAASGRSRDAAPGAPRTGDAHRCSPPAARVHAGPAMAPLRVRRTQRTLPATAASAWAIP
jgi:uncharacterized membrane protein